MTKKKNYSELSKNCCSNCNKRLKKNVVERKALLPKFCFWCYIFLVKKRTTFGSKKVEQMIQRNKRMFRR